jgi:hypothetical protein
MGEAQSMKRLVRYIRKEEEVHPFKEEKVQ